MDNEQLVEDFYRAFQAKDASRMGACYAEDATFSDPVFPGLRGAEVPAMWAMLCERGKDLEVTFSDIRSDRDVVQAHWEAVYTFSATGRRVHNVIDATMRIAGGKIVDHVDVFDFWRWSRMALGLSGVFLGWTPLVRNKVRAQSRKFLEQYMQK